MMSMLCVDILAIFQDGFMTFLVNTFQLDRFLIPVIFAILGLSLAVLARRITRMVRKTNEVDDNDMCYITIKAISLGCLFVALMFLVMSAIQYL